MKHRVYRLFLAAVLLAILTGSVLAGGGGNHRNPYRNRVLRSYDKTLDSYNQLMKLYYFPYANPHSVWAAYFRYMKQLSTYKALLRKYYRWEREHQDDDNDDNDPNPWPPYATTKRVRIERQGTYQPCVVPDPINIGLINGGKVARSVNLRVGQCVTFRIVTNPSTGYSWHTRFTRRGIASIVSKKSVGPRPKPYICGAPSYIKYTVRAARPGRTTLKLRYKRGHHETARQINLTILVYRGGGGSGPYQCVERWNTRSRIIYRVVSGERLIRRLSGQVVRVCGKWRRGPTPYTGTVRIIRVIGGQCCDEGDYSDDNPGWDDIIQNDDNQDNNDYDQDGYDQDGYDQDGYDRDGYDRQGYDRQGYDRQGYDRDGYDRDGYDHDGYDRDGYDRKGKPRPNSDNVQDNSDNVQDNSDNVQDNSDNVQDNSEYVQDNSDNVQDNSDNVQDNSDNVQDNSEYDRDGYDQDGYDRDGYDRKGYDRDGYDRNGYDRKGYDRDGYDRDGYDRDGYDRKGLDRKGKPRPPKVDAKVINKK